LGIILQPSQVKPPARIKIILRKVNPKKAQKLIRIKEKRMGNKALTTKKEERSLTSYLPTRT